MWRVWFAFGGGRVYRLVGGQECLQPPTCALGQGPVLCAGENSALWQLTAEAGARDPLPGDQVQDFILPRRPQSPFFVGGSLVLRLGWGAGGLGGCSGSHQPRAWWQCLWVKPVPPPNDATARWSPFLSPAPAGWHHHTTRPSIPGSGPSCRGGQGVERSLAEEGS